MTAGDRPPPEAVEREFHVSRQARERYGIAGELFGLTGNVVLSDMRAVRELAERINRARDAERNPERAVLAGELNAMGVLDETLHLAARLYRERRSPRAMRLAVAALDERLGRDAVDGVLRAFVDRFPTAEAQRTRPSPDEYLAGETAGLPNREIALEEVLHLWLANANPAFGRFRELFDDTRLLRGTRYAELIGALEAFFATQPRFGPDERDLVGLLRSPAIAVPDSLPGQLQYVGERWGGLLGDAGQAVLRGRDMLQEEATARWRRFHPIGPAPAQAPGLAADAEVEAYSFDRAWMPQLVLLAKSTYVWLEQLGREYARPIGRLDEIPDEALDRLAAWGVTGLWLIGLWQRSRASARIKRIRGNPDAAASAYSLDDYRIADDLGGEEAWAALAERARRRGIRLASDMVPNHMGIDSRWVIEHPERFLSLAESPFPSYSFSGPDLSDDERVGIFLEDHYWDGTDAAVVFKRVDRATGEARYVYHGNDGTSMPWNDTAQLDYLRADVREVVIETIVDVARRFPVIRFDAAMTLAKRHIARLWYPPPGSGGAIPSRAEHGLTADEFDRRMPGEFWREVVDRVAVEAPDTLLLAEAFWLMEGYFVRTLGMHRVYNSAFMNMLRDERNAEYRAVIRKTLEFDPEILKRYVNFMNNPDERTAVDQFGKGDKYFGVCTLMVTLPGLPMLGHGQIEGFAERYGMEFRRPQWDEQADRWLVERHEREIFPLLHRRAAFAEVEDFLLYDLVTDDGSVNEDVFAYSNRARGERSLVVYHNRYAEARGRIRQSVGYAAKGDDGGLKRRTLGEGLGLTDADDVFAIFRDTRSGLEYVHPSRALCRDGLAVELDAYRCQVFVDWREVTDAAGVHRRLSERLAGGGVPSVQQAIRDLELEPVAAALRSALEADAVPIVLARTPVSEDQALARFEERLGDALARAGQLDPADGDPATSAAEARAALEVGMEVLDSAALVERRAELLAWVIVRAFGGARRFDELKLDASLASALRALGVDEATAWRTLEVARLLADPARVAPAPASADAALTWRRWMADPSVRRLAGVNRHEGVDWVRREELEGLLWWTSALPHLVAAAEPVRRAARQVAVQIGAAAAAAGYRLDAMADALASVDRSDDRRPAAPPSHVMTDSEAPRRAESPPD